MDHTHSSHPMNYNPEKSPLFQEILHQFWQMCLEIWGYTQDAILAIKKDLLEASRPFYPPYQD